MDGKSGGMRAAAVVLVLVLLLSGVWAVARTSDLANPEEAEAGAAGLAAPSGAGVGSAAGQAAAAAQDPGPLTVIEIKSEKNDVTRPLREMPVLPPKAEGKEKERENPPLKIIGHVDQDDPVVQTALTGSSTGAAAPQPAAATAGVVFEGINQAGGCGNCAPPDTNGDVGLSQYVQTVNSSFAVYSKTGTKLYGPAAINTVWQGFGGPCQTRNDGDPIMVYDGMADRWLISQFTAASPYYECIAISQTGDATGAWYRYAFQLSTSDFPDYPKFGVWPDGYYMSVNWFVGGSTYGGPRPYVFDRASMLAGQPAAIQTTNAALGSSVNPLLPADLDGATQPTGKPGLFASLGSAMNLYKFAVNWTTPSASTWSQSASLAIAGFRQLCPTSRNCVPQYGTQQKLDGLGDRLMNRAVYRNMGTYESLLLSHAVDAGSNRRTTRAGMRWYEIRNPFGTPSIYQQSTYAPSDTLYRWMGSIAMDKLGNIGLGFSASGSGTGQYPSIRYTGRAAGDPAGSMTQGDNVMYQGTGYQSGVNRWGDYSNLSVDPSDDCTFWYTQEYNNSKGWAWGTKIGSFKINGCQ